MAKKVCMKSWSSPRNGIILFLEAPWDFVGQEGQSTKYLEHAFTKINEPQQKLFLAPTRSSGNVNVCLLVCPVQVCLEHSIIMQSLSGLSTDTQQSLGSLLAVS